MQTFQFTRAKNVGDAVKAGAKSKTAQQGADVRYLAGGIEAWKAAGKPLQPKEAAS